MLLPRGEVAVWVLRCDSAEADHLSAFCRVLDEHERTAAARFHFEHDRRDYLCAHALMRCMLSVYGGSRADSWVFQKDRFGKPEIVVPPCEPRLRFNLSHTSGLVACAATWEWDIGLDVECCSRTVEIESLSERFLLSTK